MKDSREVAEEAKASEASFSYKKGDRIMMIRFLDDDKIRIHYKSGRTFYHIDVSLSSRISEVKKADNYSFSDISIFAE